MINNVAGMLDQLGFADGSTASLSELLAQATTGITAATSAVDVTLPEGIQNMILTGTANLTAIGNDLADVITANSGNGGTGNREKYIGKTGNYLGRSAYIRQSKYLLHFSGDQFLYNAYGSGLAVLFGREKFKAANDSEWRVEA